MAKSRKQMAKDLSFTLKVDITRVPKFTQKGDFERYLCSIRCGNTVHKAKKGKGSYVRHPKHRNRSWDY
jgi:hypothetical protein